MKIGTPVTLKEGTKSYLHFINYMPVTGIVVAYNPDYYMGRFNRPYKVRFTDKRESWYSIDEIRRFDGILEEPLDYQDDDGRWHIMAACGHYVSGGVLPGDNITMCPNCQFIIKFKEVPVIYPKRINPNDKSKELHTS